MKLEVCVTQPPRQMAAPSISFQIIFRLFLVLSIAFHHLLTAHIFLLFQLVPLCDASVVRIDEDSSQYKAVLLGGFRNYSISQSRHGRTGSCEIDKNASPHVPEIGKAYPEDEEVSGTTLVVARDSNVNSLSSLIHIARGSCMALPGSKSWWSTATRVSYPERSRFGHRYYQQGCFDDPCRIHHESRSLVVAVQTAGASSRPWVVGCGFARSLGQCEVLTAAEEKVSSLELCIKLSLLIWLDGLAVVVQL